MHENHMSSNESIIVMCIFTVLAGMISGMNSFVDKIEDIRLNINDFYMSWMMSGLMFIFMAFYYEIIYCWTFYEIKYLLMNINILRL